MEIERMKTANVLLVVGAVATLSLVGCDQKSNPVTKAADATKAAADKATTAAKDATKGAVDASKDAVKGAADAAKDATKGAVDAGKDAVKGAADAAKDATKGVTDAAAKALEAAKGEGTKWLTDTVEKQWPRQGPPGPDPRRREDGGRPQELQGRRLHQAVRRSEEGLGRLRRQAG
jgi:hypothetical protein